MEIQISIILATYNASASLKKCIDSIISQINRKCELIIIDGGSIDSTNEIIKSYGSKIAYTKSEKDNGIYDAWNKGINVAKGKWVAFIGADDFLIPGTIDSYLNMIENDPNIDAYDYICSRAKREDRHGRITYIGEAPVWSKYRWGMCAVHVMSLHNKRNLFDTIGCYDIHFRICADYELLLRKRESLRYVYMDFLSVHVKAGGMSYSVEAIKETFLARKQNRTLPIYLNSVKFIYDLILFMGYKLRKFILYMKY